MNDLFVVKIFVVNAGEEKFYLSSDSIDSSDRLSKNDQALTPDFLNKIKASGLPNQSQIEDRVSCDVA